MLILKLKSQNVNTIAKTAVKFIKQGKILICPTDTIYGLVCDAANKKAVQKIFKIKKRPKGKPIPIFVKDIKMAKKLAFIDKKQEKLLKKYWPGKITVILKPRRKFSNGIGIPKEEIGLRIPKYNFLNILLKKLNFPLAQTSANISGCSPKISIKEVMELFDKDKPDLIIDGGILKNKQSKIIDLKVNPPKILRP